MLTSRLAAHPRRTLIAVLLFVVLAGVVGGPVAGALESSGGFVAPGADSEVAIDRIEAATGREPGAGIVLLVDRPSPERLAEGLKELPGVTEVRARGLMVAADISADAPDVARRALLEQRLVINATGPGTLRFVPPLTVTDAEIDTALERLYALL